MSFNFIIIIWKLLVIQWFVYIGCLFTLDEVKVWLLEASQVQNF